MGFFSTLKNHFKIELEGSNFFWYVLCYASPCIQIFRSVAFIVFVYQRVEKTWNCLWSKRWQAFAVVLRAKRAKPPQGGGPKGRRKPQVRRNEVSAVEFASVYYIKFVKFAKIPIFELQKRYVPDKLKSPKFVQTIIYHRRNINQNFVNFRWTV